MRRLQQRSKTPTLVREEEELSEKATLSDPSSASRRPKTGLNRLLRNPASSHDVIAAGELAPFSVDMWSADKPLHRSDDFSSELMPQISAVIVHVMGSFLSKARLVRAVMVTVDGH